MSRLEKGISPPSTMPGNCFRFIPKLGSGRVLSVTSAPTTVPGISAECQPLAAKPGVEMASPEERSTQDDCIFQMPCRSNLGRLDELSLAERTAGPKVKRENARAAAKERKRKPRKVVMIAPERNRWARY